jgi:hypothetical protein
MSFSLGPFLSVYSVKSIFILRSYCAILITDYQPEIS